MIIQRKDFQPMLTAHDLQHTDADHALELIMDAYGESVKRLVYTYVKDWAAADDITQEVFVKAYLHLDSFRKEASVKSWVFSIAMNQAKDYMRSAYIRKIFVPGSWFFSKNELAPPPQENDELTETILELPIKYREVIILHYYKDVSVQDMSELLHTNISTVKTRLTRARELLKNKIKEDRFHD